MEKGGAPPEGDSPVSAAATGGGPMRNIVWILLITGVLFGTAYFLRGLRPVGPEAGPTSSAEGEFGQPESAAQDHFITPEDLPGFETEQLTNAQRLWLYHRAHLEQCACECGMTVAQCRVEDPTCPESPGRSVELVREAREAVPDG